FPVAVHLLDLRLEPFDAVWPFRKTARIVIQELAVEKYLHGMTGSFPKFIRIWYLYKRMPGNERI
ncbi:MAG: hypothetical protein ABFS32_17595, partial [Bacteroidota bacterium]